MRFARAGILLAVIVLTGCAGHDAKTLAARNALDAGDPHGALKALNDELEVSSEKDLPAKVAGDNALLLLDRAMVLQELEKYPLSSRDLEVSDKQIEILDLSGRTGSDIGRYLYSDDAGHYKAPVYEKLMINTMNIMNYLARSDLNGARIEARRLAVMQKFSRDTGDAAEALLGPGSYLAGFVFEKSGRPDEALRYYDDALAYGSYDTLADPIRRLSQHSGYSSPRIKELLAKNPPGSAGSNASDADCELLVIVNYGRVPAKIAKRIPIGLALTYASGFIADASQANRLAAQGLVTWVNYPELGKARGTYGRPTFTVDNQPAELEGIVAVDREAQRAWDKGKGAIIASAITRAVTRFLAGETTDKVAGGGLLGAVLSIGTQATLSAADTPDTRNWSTLPARVAFGRVRVPAGSHAVTLTAAGGRKKQTLTLSPGGWGVVVLTALN
jgi:tetratricopeptide (TPR) repeat protein